MGYDLVRSSERLSFIATCDLAAIVRGRAPIKVSSSPCSVGWVPADLALTAFGTIAQGHPFGACGDLRLVPDGTTSLVLPANNDGTTPELEIRLATQTRIDGAPWECCPRAFLASGISDLREQTGLIARVSFEHEFTLSGTSQSAPFSLARLRTAEPFGSRLVRGLIRNGFNPENWLAEYADGQFEITLAPSDPMTAADRAILLRELVRDLARQEGLPVTFAPLTHPENAGNGVHIHWSLWTEDRQPALYDASRPGMLSEIGNQFCTGILRHVGAATAITAPSVVSYLRFGPHRWSVSGAYLAERDREALLRICPPSGAIGLSAAGQYNIEFRACDATANPWLAVGILIRAGLEGIRAGYTTKLQRGDDPLHPLPESLEEALKALEEDDIAPGWFPENLLSTYLLVKRAEISALDGLDELTQCRRIAGVY
jgi:glutamine synthetase